MEAYLEIVAPFDGVITERKPSGQSGGPPDRCAMLRIEQVSRLRLTVPVPESDGGTIVKGTRSGFPRVHPISVSGRRQSRPFSGHENAKHARRARSDQSWTIDWRQGCLPRSSGPCHGRKLPCSCRPSVVRTSERQFVVRLRNGVAEWVDVRREQVNGDLIEVFGELREGDVVARRGSDEIRPGARVSAVTPASR